MCRGAPASYSILPIPIINMDDQIEARERRRAKILASKDARMARITGAHKNEDSPPIEVDEVLVQEFIAESKKHAVELAKEDYSLTHKENEDRPDSPLNPQEIQAKKEEKVKSQLAQFHQQQSKFDIFTSSLVVIVAASTAAFFLLKRAKEASLDFCFDFAGIGGGEARIETCRQGVLPIFLQTVPGTLVVALLPSLSDWFKGRKSLVQVVLSIFPKILMFVVFFIIFLRILQ